MYVCVCVVGMCSKLYYIPLQVSMFSPSVRKHYLNITADNIVRVYTVNGRVIDIAKVGYYCALHCLS